MEEYTNILENDIRTKCLTVPALLMYDNRNLEQYPNYVQPKYNVEDILNYCDKNTSCFMKDLIMDFLIVCNNIAHPLIYGTQIEYNKHNKDSFQKLWDIQESASAVFGIIHDAVQNGSANFFNKQLRRKNILVSSKFLKELNNDLDKSIFNLFTNPNYVNNDVKFGSLYTYIGTRLLELARESVNKMCEIMEQSKAVSNKNAYLDQNIFGNIIVPFYNNLQKLKDHLYEMNQYIIDFDNYNKDKLYKQLRATADYINDVLNNSKIPEYHNDYLNNDNMLPEKVVNKLDNCFDLSELIGIDF